MILYSVDCCFLYFYYLLQFDMCHVDLLVLVFFVLFVNFLFYAYSTLYLQLSFYLFTSEMLKVMLLRRCNWENTKNDAVIIYDS